MAWAPEHLPVQPRGGRGASRQAPSYPRDPKPLRYATWCPSLSSTPGRLARWLAGEGGPTLLVAVGLTVLVYGFITDELGAVALGALLIIFAAVLPRLHGPKMIRSAPRATAPSSSVMN